MSKLLIEGGHRLSGEIRLQGAKNSALPILAATLLGKNRSIIHNCPNLSDVEAAVKILEYLGCQVVREEDTLTIDAREVTRTTIPEYLMREMRSSIVFLGAMLSRTGEAKISMPGGCELGPRPIDLHLDALKRLGTIVTSDHGYLDCRVEKRLRGCKISLLFPSVGATENILLASVLAEGTTVIHNAAQEPEIVDLAAYLNGRGAKIKGAGKSRIVVEGVARLKDGEHTVIPDRIVAATYLAAAAITKGEILLRQTHPWDLESIFPIFEKMGFPIHISDDEILLKSEINQKIHSVDSVRTMPYPGFPTDAQAPVMSVLSIADGTSMFVENIFANRYKHVLELNRMGADIKLEGRVAVVKGVKKLYGTEVLSEDLRGGAALVVAGLAAEQMTAVTQIHHIDRGYERIEEVLCSMGAVIRRTV